MQIPRFEWIFAGLFSSGCRISAACRRVYKTDPTPTPPSGAGLVAIGDSQAFKPNAKTGLLGWRAKCAVFAPHRAETHPADIWPNAEKFVYL